LKRSLFAAALAGIALVSTSFAARAQMATSATKPFQFGAFGGVAIPSGDLSSDFSTGFTAGATVGFNPALIPLGVRIDGAYNQFALKGGGANLHFTTVTGNLVYQMPSTSFTPYAIGGVGLYNVGGTINGVGSNSENHFGWNAGGGIKMALSGFDTFVEARYHRVTGVNGTLAWIPITFGVMF
jgi:opacity protein-like surface antigen